MKLHGNEDDWFGDMGDSTTRTFISLDYNTISPLIQKEPYKSFSVCERSLTALMNRIKEQLTLEDIENDVLILMRVRDDKYTKMTRDKVINIGWKIVDIFSEESLVTWGAQGYHMHRFDFYLYEKPELRYEVIPNASKFKREFPEGSGHDSQDPESGCEPVDEHETGSSENACLSGWH